MPNFKAIAEQMLEQHHWTSEGATTDGTELVSCPLCGALIPHYLKYKHAHWHAINEN